MNLVTLDITGTPAGPRVRVDSCPRCRRSMRLDHVSVTDEDGDCVDLGAVAFAQRLHLAQCAG